MTSPRCTMVEDLLDGMVRIHYADGHTEDAFIQATEMTTRLLMNQKEACDCGACD